MCLKILWFYSVRKSDNGKDLYDGLGVAEKKDTVTSGLFWNSYDISASSHL
jgi:hypothetical protein